MGGRRDDTTVSIVSASGLHFFVLTFDETFLSRNKVLGEDD